ETLSSEQACEGRRRDRQDEGRARLERQAGRGGRAGRRRLPGLRSLASGSESRFGNV
ncbi:MAG: hypothetical protein AVDCRST_MAG23-138, partial [uncultured Sphingosinicella sp.]